jgi:hypothetical protein
MTEPKLPFHTQTTIATLPGMDCGVAGRFDSSWPTVVGSGGPRKFGSVHVAGVALRMLILSPEFTK